jgi:hypothetical protein
MAREGASTNFIVMGVQYYVSGRFAALNGFDLVAGNLFHHAVELLLKAGLLRDYTEQEVANRTRFGHSLPKLWEEFKRRTFDPALAAFDSDIADLDRWEELRYFTPESNIPTGKTGAFFRVLVRRADQGMDPDPATTEYHEINVEAVDELFEQIVRALTQLLAGGWVDTETAVRLSLSQPEIVRVYRQSNVHQSF